ncbi:hypothetical protein SKAU_G00103440 [Synaphobranchus kaupii]|uniref:Uncharacterized protein n=1 Tax=Synaphobranchus kaupii TaxID=118154 RepID=A0A9Q1FZ20_SYNKA|nr:hypothetical protein SKAU_G00103440 [Synaphobranchus kaupii]
MPPDRPGTTPPTDPSFLRTCLSHVPTCPARLALAAPGPPQGAFVRRVTRYVTSPRVRRDLGKHRVLLFVRDAAPLCGHLENTGSPASLNESMSAGRGAQISPFGPLFF